MAIPDGEKRSFIQRLFTSIAPRYDCFNRLASCGLDQRWRSQAIDLGDVRPGQRVLDVCAGTGDLAILCARRQAGQGIVVGMDLNAQMLSWARRKHHQQRRPAVDPSMRAPARFASPPEIAERFRGLSPGNASHFTGQSEAAGEPLLGVIPSEAKPSRGTKVSSGPRALSVPRCDSGFLGGDPEAQGRGMGLHWLLGDAEALPFAEATFDRVTIGFSTRNLSDLTAGLREMVRVLRPNGRLIILETGRPRHPLMRIGYQLFLWTFVRVMGLAVTGRLWPFTYFARSVRTFLTPQQLLERLQSLATQAHYVPLSHGLASLFLATKT